MVRHLQFIATLATTSFIVSCASPLRVEKIPVSADPDRQITELSLGLSAARSRDVNLLSPSWFARAAHDHAEASEMRRSGGDASEVLGAVAEGYAALDRAESSAVIVYTTLTGAYLARTDAIQAGAAALGESFEIAESNFRELALVIEGNEFDEAVDSRDALAARYRTLELNAIKDRTLGEARKALDLARDSGAAENVPEALSVATRLLEQADHFVERNRYADPVVRREHAEASRFYAKRAFELNEAVRKIRTKTPETIILEHERRMRKLGEALGIQDRRDWPLEDQWSEIGLVAEILRSDRDFLVGENQSSRQQLKIARREVSELSGQNLALDSVRHFNALFAKARGYFTAEEAEVYRQEDQLIIRLRALEFPVGEAALSRHSYSVLAKVQRAIRTFGHPSVVVEGHTDSTGGRAVNERLSRDRADAVRNYLIANNTLPSDRIVAVGRASEDPIASNETARGRALNRRIDVILDARDIILLAGMMELATE